MMIAQEPVFQWLAQYAYQPEIVYFAIFGMMLASGFGFPLPEEVTILSVGLITYMGSQPEHFPPPFAGAPVVDGYEAALVTSASVLFADFVVFSIGRYFGARLQKKSWFERFFTEERRQKVNSWMKKYGSFSVFIFRFTPGLRFPAHVAMGMTDFPVWKFLSVDGLAVLVSVPTQILLLYHYGEPILIALQQFKFYLIGILVALGLFFLVRRYLFKLRST